MHQRLPSSLLIALSLACAEASAAAPLTAPHRDISLDGASRLLDAAMTACHADGTMLAAAVVDREGNLVALRRDHGVGPHNTAASQRKPTRRCQPKPLPACWPPMPAPAPNQPT